MHLLTMYIKLATGTKLAKRCNINAHSTNASYLHYIQRDICNRKLEITRISFFVRIIIVYLKWAVSVIWCVLIIKLSYEINLIRLFHFTRTFKYWKQVVNQWSHKLVYKTTSDFWRHLGLRGESVVDVSVKKLVWQPVLTLQPL